MWKILVVLLCLAALILLVVMICDSNRFVKVSYRISDRRLKKNCRVVLLADLHNKSYGKHNEKLLAAIKSSNPDLILCAGDLITSRSGKSMEHAKELVRAISAEYPFYYANGNHEYRIYREPQTYGKMGASYRAFLKGNHVRILENGSVLLPVLCIGAFLSFQEHRILCVQLADARELFVRAVLFLISIKRLFCCAAQGQRIPVGFIELSIVAGCFIRGKNIFCLGIID